MIWLRSSVNPAGVTIQPAVEGDGFPSYESYELFGVPDGSGDWFAREKRDGSVSGKRIFSVAAGAVVPAGFTLRWCSGGTLGGIADDTNTRDILPGETLETNGQMPIGATCYNDLFWKRTSDGAYKRAHQALSPIRFTILGLTTPTDPPPGIPNLTADATFASVAAARAHATGYFSAWTGTIPAGKNEDSDRVLKVSGSTSGIFDLTGLHNPHASASARRVIFRLDGTYTDAGCSNRHNGVVNFANSRGIHLAMTHVRGGPDAVVADDSDLCGMMQCLIEGAAPSESTISPRTDGVKLRRARNFAMLHCLTSYFSNVGLVFSNTVGLRYIGCMTDLMTEDEHVVWSGIDAARFERVWGCRKRVYGGGDPHEDFYQNQGSTETNCRFTGLVYLNANVGRGAYQGQFHKWEGDPLKDKYPLEFAGTVWNQCIGYLNNGAIKGSAANPGGPGEAIKQNTFVTAGDPGSNGHGALIDVIAPSSKNYMAAGTVAHAFRVGTGGLHRPIGTMGARDYSALVNDFRYGIPWQNASGVVVAFESQTLKAFEPKSGSPLHWGHASPVGADVRSREIFDASFRTAASAAAGYPVYPFAWPVLPKHRQRYNPDGYVSDGYTGAWNNISGLPA